MVEWGKALVHVMIHSLHYGTAVFEGIRAYSLSSGGVGVFRLRDHMARFIASAKVYRFTIPYSLDELVNAVLDVVRANGFRECYIRPIGFINAEDLSLAPSSRRLSVAIAALEWGRFLGRAYDVGARATISSWRRAPPSTLPSNAKVSGHYSLSYLTSLEARSKGFDEALMLDARGFVSEGSGENVFIVRNGTVYTPPTHASALEGITRDTVIKLLREELGARVIEKDLTVGELLTADEAFFTGTAAEVTPIVEVDGVKIGSGVPGSLTRKLQRIYDDVVHGRVPKYSGWIHVVKV